MADDPAFARLVSLACHDLRTPLATVYGFARTLSRGGELEDPQARYVGMIEAASGQMGELLDQLGVVARIESNRYEPALREADTLALAQAAAERVGESVGVSGEGAALETDVESVETALASLALCAVRHGGVPHVDIAVAGREFAIAPIAEAAGPIILGEELRDLGAAVAVRTVSALGGSVSLDGETLRIVL